MRSEDAGHDADEGEGDDRTAHLLEVALGRAEPREFWVTLPDDDLHDRPQRRAFARARRALLGGAALAALVAAAALVRSSPSDDALQAPPRPAPSAAVATPPPASTPPRLAFALPAGWSDSCRDAPALDPDASAAVVCAPGGRLLRIELRRIDSPDTRRARFVQLTQRDAGGTGVSRCAAGIAEARTWSRPEAPSVVAGAYACRVVDGAAEIVWTDERLALVARAVRVDSDLVALWRWWLSDAPGAGEA